MKQTSITPADLERLQHLTQFRFVLRKFLSFSDEASEKAGVRAQQYQLLQVIACASASTKATIAYVAERMLLRHNSAVELVGRAVEEQLLVREEDADDHRRVLLRLTKKGESLLVKLAAEHYAELMRVGPELHRVLKDVLSSPGKVVRQL